jgi:hypothetical protein
MRMPTQAPAIKRHVSVASTAGGIEPSDCSVFKKNRLCRCARGLCRRLCRHRGLACAECLAGIGASGCIDCV